MVGILRSTNYQRCQDDCTPTSWIPSSGAALKKREFASDCVFLEVDRIYALGLVRVLCLDPTARELSRRLRVCAAALGVEKFENIESAKKRMDDRIYFRPPLFIVCVAFMFRCCRREIPPGLAALRVIYLQYRDISTILEVLCDPITRKMHSGPPRSTHKTNVPGIYQ